MKSIVVSVTPEETRMAAAKDGELLEVAVERTESAHLVGNIYKGRVQNVLPGMQAAFVDIGREKNAFLYIGDGMPKNAMLSMKRSERFHVGQNVLIQVVKDAIGMKGPRATTHLTLPGRYAVLMPTVDYVGISRRIEDAGERERLKNIAGEICPAGMGVIIRTVASGKARQVLEEDIRYLLRLWKSLSARSRVSSAPALLYRDADLLIRVVRDIFSQEIDALILDQKESYQRVCELLKYASPELAKRVVLYGGEQDVFQAYHLEEEMEKLGKRQVDLKSGGFIVIDKTEALTVIDVNTGKFVGEVNLSDTVFQTNLEAAAEITKQIRLRDIGGIIIVDFIDMDTAEHKRQVLELLEEKVKEDKTKTNIMGITSLGLVEITRKKSRKNFEGIAYSACPYCNGRGMLESPETVGIKIGRHLRRLKQKRQMGAEIVVQVHPSVAEILIRTRRLSILEKELACKIKLEKLADIHPETYSILQANSFS